MSEIKERVRLFLARTKRPYCVKEIAERLYPEVFYGRALADKTARNTYDKVLKACSSLRAEDKIRMQEFYGTLIYKTGNYYR